MVGPDRADLPQGRFIIPLLRHSADVFVFSWFMLREIEVAGARVGDITVARCVVCLDLPLRKVRATMRHPARTCP